MFRSIKTIALCAGSLLGTGLNAQPVFELDAALMDVARRGSALNSGGFPLREIPDMEAGRIDARLGHGIFETGFLTLGLRLEETNAPDFIALPPPFFPIAPSGDTMRASRMISLQLGSPLGALDYGGIFAVGGTVDFTLSNFAQDADFRVFGLEAYHDYGDWRVNGQLGRITSKAADPETLDNANFLALGVSRHFADGRGRITLRGALARGDQDTDSGAGPDRVDLRALGVEAAWSLSKPGSAQPVEVYAALDDLNIVENRNIGANQRVRDRVVSIGLRIRFNGNGRLAPRLPQFGRWLGAVPALD